MTELIGRYLKEIEKLKARLIESEQMYQQLKKSTAQAARVKHVMPFGDTEGTKSIHRFAIWRYFMIIFCFRIDVEEVIDMAKRKLEKERELFMSKSLPGGYAADGNHAVENESDSDDDSDESDEKGRRLLMCLEIHQNEN